MNQDPNSHDQQLEKAERVAYLIAAHINGTLSTEEKDELDEWITQSDENLELFEKLTDEDNVETAMQQYMEMEKEKAAALAGIKQRIRTGEKRSVIDKI